MAISWVKTNGISPILPLLHSRMAGGTCPDVLQIVREQGGVPCSTHEIDTWINSTHRE